jgi:serine acetyltransferase
MGDDPPQGALRRQVPRLPMGRGGMREWVFQDWAVNVGRPDVQFLLAWFRLAQWARYRWSWKARLVVTPYWWFTRMVVGVELPLDGDVGPRLRLYHPQNIVVNPGTSMGADCRLRHGVTIGNRVDRDENELGSATIGEGVDLGAGCVVIGDVHVGDHARIGALAVVTRSVPPWAVVARNPGQVIRIDEASEHDGPSEQVFQPGDGGVNL